jgi:hypothetical protein
MNQVNQEDGDMASMCEKKGFACHGQAKSDHILKGDL